MNNQAATVSRIPADRLPEYVNATERAIAALIVSELISSGYALSVYDGEEWALKQSRDAGEVCAALASTDADVIRARVAGDSEWVRVGSVTLIWGNGRDLLSDWSWSQDTGGDAFNARMESIAAEVERQTDARGRR